MEEIKEYLACAAQMPWWFRLLNTVGVIATWEGLSWLQRHLRLSWK